MPHIVHNKKQILLIGDIYIIFHVMSKNRLKYCKCIKNAVSSAFVLQNRGLEMNQQFRCAQ